MSRRFAILEFKKLMHPSHLAAAEGHNRRLKPPANADPTRALLNVDLLPDQQNFGFNERVERRMAALNVRHHKREVLAVELILGMSEEAQVHVPLDQWQGSALAAAHQIAGSGNIVGANVHFDERTPHLHVVFLPIVEVERQQRGPLPKSGFRKRRKFYDLSFAAFAGKTKREVSRTVSGWHDIYAGHTRSLGLERGVVGGSIRQIPQQQLYAETAEVDSLADALLALLNDPSALFAGVRRPTAAELGDDAKWRAYRELVTGNAQRVLSKATGGLSALIALAQGGLFEKRAREKLRHLDEDRNQWKNRAQDAETAKSQLADAHGAEMRALQQRLAAAETSPLCARDIAGILGLPLHVRRSRDGRPLDQVVNAAGEILTLKEGAFVQANGSRQSVVRFLQNELQLTSLQEVYAVLAENFGEARALATFAATFQQAHAGHLSEVSRRLQLPTAHARQLALQTNLQTFLNVSPQTTARLMGQNRLTVNSRGHGVLLPGNGDQGYQFSVGTEGCVALAAPADFAPVQLGYSGTWTQLVTEDIGLSLQALDATQGNIACALVPPRTLTEDRLKALKSGHRETLATAGAFTPGWDPSMSALVRAVAEMLPRVTEIMRSDKHPIFSEATGKKPTEMDWQ